jgi:hypothetical protein
MVLALIPCYIRAKSVAYKQHELCGPVRMGVASALKGLILGDISREAAISSLKRNKRIDPLLHWRLLRDD